MLLLHELQEPHSLVSMQAEHTNNGNEEEDECTFHIQ